MYVVASARGATRREEVRDRSEVKTAFRSHRIQREWKRFKQQVEKTRRRAQIRQLASEKWVPKGGGKGGRGAEKEGNGGVGGELVELDERGDEVEEGGDEVSVSWEEECGEEERQQGEGSE